VSLFDGINEGSFKKSALADTEKIANLVDLFGKLNGNLGANVLERQRLRRLQGSFPLIAQDVINNEIGTGVVDEGKSFFRNKGINLRTHGKSSKFVKLGGYFAIFGTSSKEFGSYDFAR
jgi:hypothetical protein